MATITPDNPNKFKNGDIIFSKVNRFLHSYKDANLIDEGEFPTYVKEVLRELGIGVYKEQDAILKVKNYKAKLPLGFSVLYAAYKCTPSFNVKDTIHPQSTVSVFNDVTWELVEGGHDGCIIDCCKQDGIIEKITVRQNVEEKTLTANFVNPVLLRLSPNVKKSKCTDDCENLLASSPFEISIDDGFLITNFNEDSVYIKYYEFPTDEDGMPMIPDIEEVEKTIEWYIIYQLLLRWHVNKEVSDIERTLALAENKYKEFMGKSKYYLKLPSFSNMVNNIRRQRSTNLLMLIAQQG